jgi:hypothetical protein
VLQENPQDWLTITVQNNASSIDGIVYYNSQGQLLNQISATSNAGATNSIHIDLTTDGPQRPGILQWQWTPIWQGNPGDFYASLNYKIGQYSGSCGGSIGLCSGPGSNAPPIAFALGTPFTFDSVSSLFVDSIDANSSGYDGLLLNFRFLEADGSTFVMSSEQQASAPEPSTSGFGLLCIGLVLITRYRRTRR